MPVGIRPLVCCCSCEVSWFSRVCCQLLRHLLSSISISAIKCSRCRSSHPNFRRRAMGSHGNGKTQMMSYSEFKQFANTINVDRTRVEQLWLLWGKLSFVRQPLVESHLTLYRLYRISRCFRRVLRVACVGLNLRSHKIIFIKSQKCTESAKRRTRPYVNNSGNVPGPCRRDPHFCQSGPGPIVSLYVALAFMNFMFNEPPPLDYRLARLSEAAPLVRIKNSCNAPRLNFPGGLPCFPRARERSEPLRKVCMVLQQ